MRGVSGAVWAAGMSLVLAACGFEQERSQGPIAAPRAEGIEIDGADESGIPGPSAVREVLAWEGPQVVGGTVGRDGYELLSLRRDGWNVEACVATPEGKRDLHYELRLDGERFSWGGAVQDGNTTVWEQRFTGAVDGSQLVIEESDGVDRLRIEITRGEREEYTLWRESGEVRRLVVSAGAEDSAAWADFWPEDTGLDWNRDGHLYNGLAQGRVLRDEVDHALRATVSIGDPHHMHPLLEQVCNLIRTCTIMKCREGGPSNSLCGGCEVGTAICDLLRLIFG